LIIELIRILQLEDWMKRVDPLAGVATFLALAELKSFAATAKRLDISAATVSSQVADLEERLAVRLVHRSTRHVSLTSAGVAYLSALDGLLDQAQRANGIATSQRGDLSGSIRITAPLGAHRRLLQPTIDHFIEHHPTIAIELDVSAAPVDLVEGAYDLAIRATHTAEPNWITRKIAESPVRVVASPAYVARHGQPAEPADITAHETIHFSALSFGKIWMFRRGDTSERIAIRPRLQSNDGQALHQWALDGYGIALLPDFLIGDDLIDGRLVTVLPEWHAPSVDISAVYPDNKHISARVKLFVDSLVATNRVPGE
jgi:DNA-binding transcriptional LysR family regulator